MIKTNGKSLNALLVYFLLLVATFILLYPVIITKQGSFCITSDNRQQAYPFFHKLASSLNKGYLPVWDANTYSGKNFSGEFQAGIFYPLNILWCLLFGTVNGIDVYYVDLLVVFHYFICAIGMYLLGRVLKFSLAASIATALVFTFTGSIAARSGGQTCIFFGLALLPWVNYFVSKYYLVHNKKRYLIFAGLFCGLEILAGHIQPFFHTLLISGVIIIFYEFINRKDWKTFLLSVSITSAIILLTALIVSLPQVYYAAEYMSQCYRWVGENNFISPGEKVPQNVYAYKNIIEVSNVFNFLGKDYTPPDDGNRLYMGILPFFLFMIYLIKNKSLKTIRDHTYLRKILIIILMIGILSALGYVTFFYFLIYQIPLVNAIRELGRYGILLNFSASLIVGLAITNISELKKVIFQNSPKVKFYVLLALTINALYLIAFETRNIPLKVSIPFLLGFLFFLFLMYSKGTLFIPVLVVPFIFVDLYLNSVDYASTQSVFYPTKYYKRNSIINFLETTYGRYRVALEVQNDDSLRRNIGNVYNIQTKMGYGATMNKPYFDFIRYDWSLNSEVNDLLNIKYIVTDKILDTGFIFKDSTEHLNLYERKNYYPRIYWKSQLGKRGREIEEENRQTIRQLEYSDLHQKVEVDCNATDTLIISENNYPGWECYDNGRKIPIFSASIKDHPSIFRSLALDKGHHIIEFKYNKVFYWF